MIIAEQCCQLLDLLGLYFDSLVYLLSIVESSDVYLLLHKAIEPVIELGVALWKLILVGFGLIK
jgi:hypothetical protein